MAIEIIPKDQQASGQFNGGQIVENKPIGFPQDGGNIRPYSNLFYWAYAEAVEESTIGLHPHQGFEIMSFVLKGAIRHYDTKLKEWRRLEAGDAQIIRSGNGISHAEHMEDGAAMFQIWIDPNLGKTLEIPASYDDYKSSVFPVSTQDGIKIKTFVGKDSPFQMDTEGVEITELSFGKGNFEYSLDEENVYSLYLLKGAITIDGENVNQDDFVRVIDVAQLKIESESDAKIFMISSPKDVLYKTYAELMQERMYR
jgi:redox-sensitive bicupin YhaK (pirin superfamily)